MMALAGKSIVSKKVSTLLRHAQLFPGSGSHAPAVEFRDQTPRCHFGGKRTVFTSVPSAGSFSAGTRFAQEAGAILRRRQILTGERCCQYRCFLPSTIRMFSDQSESKQKPPVTQAGPLSENEPTETAAETTITTAAGATNSEEEERKRKEAFQKKAMKWSLIAMGLSLTGAAGFAILEWGNLISGSSIFG